MLKLSREDLEGIFLGLIIGLVITWFIYPIFNQDRPIPPRLRFEMMPSTEFGMNCLESARYSYGCLNIKYCNEVKLSGGDLYCDCIIG